MVAKKPLQLHIGGHSREFMMQSYVVLRDALNAMKRIKACEKPSNDFKNRLKKKVIEKEDTAFKNTANKSPGWIAHPGPILRAERYVKDKNNLSEIKYPNLK